ncbi:MAG: metallophosphoesterase [Coriobacteriia bacterium]|nr:metallophosphoesterase [Coriobacteriia bacterium]
MRTCRANIAPALLTLAAATLLALCAATPAQAKAVLNRSSLELHHKTTATLTLKGIPTSAKVTWSTSAKSRVTVKKISYRSVRLSGLKAGKATVTATYRGKRYRCAVTVPSYKLTKQVKGTCSTRGKLTYWCYRCRKHYSVYTATVANAHAWAASPSKSKAATCTEGGCNVWTCTRNGRHTKKQATAALGHQWDDGMVVTPATYEADGLLRRSCMACDQTKDQVIPQLTDETAPVSARYDLTDPGTGSAGGLVTVTLNPVTVAFRNDVVVQWANDQGALEGYAPLAPQHATSTTVSLAIPEQTLIPAGATALRVHTRIGGMLSRSYVTCPLPEHSGFTPTGTPLARFQILSDVHVNQEGRTGYDGNEHLPLALADAAQVNPGGKTIIVGDMADRGREAEYRMLYDMVEAQDGMSAADVYFAMGNHDYYGHDANEQGAAKSRALFRTYASQGKQIEFGQPDGDSPWYAVKLDGLHHIMLGSDTYPIDGVDAYLSTDQTNWLQDQLTIAQEDTGGKPIFVYLHQSLYNTIAGSFPGQGWDGVENAKSGDVVDSSSRARLIKVLQQFPQVILFNGHSHWIMDSPGNLHARNDGSSGQDGLPTILNTSSAAYLWTSYADPQDQAGAYKKGSEGYYVTVYDDCTLVQGRDFANGRWLPSASYVVPHAR